jgi:hypothetical protein
MTLLLVTSQIYNVGNNRNTEMEDNPKVSYLKFVLKGLSFFLSFFTCLFRNFTSD